MTMQLYEIWVDGIPRLMEDEGMVRPPRKNGEMIAVDFHTACLKFELKNALENIEKKEIENGNYSAKEYMSFYHAYDNHNSWHGNYYPSEQDALNENNKYLNKRAKHGPRDPNKPIIIYR